MVAFPETPNPTVSLSLHLPLPWKAVHLHLHIKRSSTPLNFKGHHSNYDNLDKT